MGLPHKLCTDPILLLNMLKVHPPKRYWIVSGELNKYWAGDIKKKIFTDL